MKIKISLLTIIIGLAGCATQGTNAVNITQREPKQISNEVQLNEPYTQVWDKLVKELSKSFYVINNIDKESRIINLSFSSQTPTDYIDCGETHRTFTQGDKTENFNYDIADSTVFKIALPINQNRLSFSNYAVIKRNTSLEGRANVYLAPLENDKSKTTVAVNSRFILTIDVSGDAYAQAAMSGNVLSLGPLPPPKPSVISFNTNKPIEHNFGEGVKSTCFSTGKLEQDVLQILQK